MNRFLRNSQIRIVMMLTFVCSICLMIGASDAREDIVKKIGGEKRASIHVSTDKPIYKIGETVYARALAIDAHTRETMTEISWANFEVISPKGSPFASGLANAEEGAVGWSWQIPADAAGGIYKLKISFPRDGFAPVEREFEIRAYRAPRMKTQIEFLREGYGPSDNVAATLNVTRSEGGVPEGATVTIIARVDEQETWRGQSTVPANGVVEARFALPNTIVYGNGVLSFVIADGGTIETASKTIPILLSQVDLQVYPEAGELVPGVKNRVYFEAISPNGRPAEIKAELVDASGAVILSAIAEHEGRGRFEFTPDAGATYKLRVVEPWTVTTEREFTSANDGVVLRSLEDITPAGAPVKLLAASPTRRNLIVIASSREKEIARMDVSLGANGSNLAEFEMQLPATADGVLRITALDVHSGHAPVAERLVFRAPSRTMKVEIIADKQSYMPAAPVTLKLRTMDENGKPVSGFVGLTVTDDATLEMVENREKAPRLPVQVYLENDVRDLKDAQIYLSGDEEAPLAVDLLLGTQGWRRFAFYTVDEFLAKFGEQGRRALAYRDEEIVTRRARMAFGGEVMMLGAEMAMAPAPVGAPAMAAFEQDFEEFNEIEFDGAAGVEVFAVAELPMEEPPADKEMAAMPALARVGKLEAEAGIGFARREVTAFVAVREYAHKTRANRVADDRSDFTETVYWSAATKTDENGEASVAFDLSDSVTTFRVLADAWSGKGAFGAADQVIESRRPFFVEAKAPLEITGGDRILLPVTVVNDTDERMTAAVLASAADGIIFGDYPGSVELAPRSRRRVIIPITSAASVGEREITITAGSEKYSDHVTRKIPSTATGFPVRENFSGLIENNITHRLTLPDSLESGSAVTVVEVYPSPLANMTSALKALIREPNGCFEQTSSTNYPLVMALQYFNTHSGVDPALVRESREKLDTGYKRLVGFECGEKGYEWFGQSPAHEALTAYGLLEFSDMAQIYAVDPKMMERTRAWLLERRDGNGGFKRDPKALDSFGRAPDDVTNAYIVWALTSAGEKDIARELDSAIASAQSSQDPYVLALAAGALIYVHRDAEAAPLLKSLAAKQGDHGAVQGAKTSITGSGGSSLDLETTSLAVLGWLTDSAYAGNVEKAMRWIATQCEGGAFGSTQSTVLVLKAIIEYDSIRAKDRKPGSVTLVVDGKTIGELAYDGETKNALKFDSFAAMMVPGEHTIELRQKDGSAIPYSIEVGYNANKPESALDCPLEWTTEVASQDVMEGEAVEVIATIKNKTSEGLPMTLAVVGLPGGLEPRHEQLKELMKEGIVDFYEVIGRDIALYFRDRAPGEETRIVLSTTAAVPGTWKGSASRAGLYYTPEAKVWVEGLEVSIQARP